MLNLATSRLLLPPALPMEGTEGMATTVASGTSYLLHQVSAGRKAVITKMHAHNRGGASAFLYLGDSADGSADGAFTQRMPGIEIMAGHAELINADHLIRREFDEDGNILARISASTTLDVLIEVEEF